MLLLQVTKNKKGGKYTNELEEIRCGFTNVGLKSSVLNFKIKEVVHKGITP